MRWVLFFSLVFLTIGITHTKAEEITYQAINQLLGIKLLTDDNLWDDSDHEAAKRLKWPLEGRTSLQSSYRYYPVELSYQVLDSITYTAALYCISGKPHRISLMFANKGDYPPFQADTLPSKEQIKKFEKVLEREEEKVVAQLSSLFGKPQKGRLGKGKRLRERVQRWDWKGHAFLLSVQDGEYVSLRVTTKEFADDRGLTDNISDSELKAVLAQRVVRRDNGDVILSEIPMADQGPKGYCVPATWERYLRYLDIPADMYVLARAGSSGFGGGTYLKPISEAVDDLAGDFGRKLHNTKADLDTKKLANYIDKGLPLMWAVYSDSLLYKQVISERTQQRSQVTDWSAWNEKLEKARSAVEEMEGLRVGGHVCMIIGYNEETQEIATSDSWGKRFQERWMTVEEAEAISQNKMQIVRW